MSERYVRFDFGSEGSYIRNDVFEQLRKVNAAIFDCDGVLIDIRESYNRTICEAVSYIIEKLTGTAFPEDLISRKVICRFKRSGGFNNDWDLTYTILMLVLYWLPRKARKALQQNLEEHIGFEDNSLDRLLSISNSITKELDAQDFDKILVGLEGWLEGFAAKADASGIASVENALENSSPTLQSQGFRETVRRVLSYPGDVNKSLVVRVFEEIFCGRQLFEEVYQVKPLFYHGRGLAEDERVILESQTLDQLSSLFGRENFGVSSGRPYELARRKLGRILDRFNHRALVFLEALTSQTRFGKNQESATSLVKPNPFSLLRSSNGLEPFEFALYAGDSMEDLLMTREANRVDPRILFVGVYEYSDCKEDVLKWFIESRAEVVIPSVNELPTVLKAVMGVNRE